MVDTSRNGLRAYLLYSPSELESFAKQFERDLYNARHGEPSTLSNLSVNSISHESQVKNTKPFQVMVIGGTDTEIANARVRGAQVSFSGKQKIATPKFETAHDFTEFIGDYVNLSADNLAINFGFPLSPDGVLLTGTKGYEFDGLVGKNVGVEVAKAVKNYTGHDIRVNVANDTVCLAYADPAADAVLIDGTGYNLAYIDGDNIKMEMAKIYECILYMMWTGITHSKKEL